MKISFINKNLHQYMDTYNCKFSHRILSRKPGRDHVYRLAAKERIRCRECVSPSPNAAALYSSSPPRVEAPRDWLSISLLKHLNF